MNNENISNVKKLLMGMPNNPAAIVALEALAKVEADFKTLNLKLETITADRDAEMRMKAQAQARDQRDKVSQENKTISIENLTAIKLLEEVLEEVPHAWLNELADKIRNFLEIGK